MVYGHHSQAVEKTRAIKAVVNKFAAFYHDDTNILYRTIYGGWDDENITYKALLLGEVQIDALNDEQVQDFLNHPEKMRDNLLVV